MARLATLSTHATSLFAARAEAQHVIVDLDNYTITILDPILPPLTYIPTTTGLAFHRDNTRVRCVRGHVGSGKTVMACAEIIFRACKMTPCRDGVRRSRWAVIRNTYGDLERNTLHTWWQWFTNLGVCKIAKSPAYSITHTFNDGHGIVVLELLPIGLDRMCDIPKHLKSLEVTGVFLNEISELYKLVLDMFSGGRLPRFPRTLDFTKEVQEQEEMYWSGVFSDTNPPEEDSWIYNLFEIQKPEGYKMFVQPPAVIKTENGYIINPAAENIKNAPNGKTAYLNMVQGHDENYIRIYLQGEYGTLTSEKRVYVNYNDNLHSTPTLALDHKEPLIIAADLGTVAPAILFAQFVRGQLRVVKEFCGEFITIAELCETAVRPYLAMYCSDMRIAVVIHDPADTYDGAAQLRAFFGEIVQPAETNNIEMRIHAAAACLNKLVAGKAMLVVSQDGCPQLRKGFNGKYYYRRLRVIGEERYTEEPHKNHPYSDVHDALQYICLWVNKELLLEKEDNRFADYERTLWREKANRITGY